MIKDFYPISTLAVSSQLDPGFDKVVFQAKKVENFFIQIGDLSNPDFSSKVGSNLVIGLVTSCCSCKAAVCRGPACC